MLKGDLSNRALPIIAFNFENVFMNPISSYEKLFFSKYKQIKRNFVAENTKILKQIWNKNNAQIHIISLLDSSYCKEIEEFLRSELLLYNSFYSLSEEDLSFKCDYHYLYYIDNQRNYLANTRTFNEFKGVLC